MRRMPHFSFIRTRRFFPIFVAQALGAFNDNFFRNAMSVWVTFHLAELVHVDAATIISLAAATFMLPFFLFSAIAGEIADRVAKHKLVVWLKAWECVLCAIAGVSLFLDNPWLMLFSLFLLGTQAAMFGPVKYAILPELLPKETLLNANAIVEAGTFLCILAGTLLGGLLVLRTHGLWMVSAGMMAMALVGLWAARKVPAVAADAHGEHKLHWNVVASTVRIVREVLRIPALLKPVLGISWFWALGAVYLTQFPVLVKQVYGGNEEVVTLLVAVFSVGIAIGAWLCGSLFHGKGLRTSMIALAIFSADLWWVAQGYVAPEHMVGVRAFLQNMMAYRIIGDVVAVAVAGGVFVVPLYTRLQTGAEACMRARVIAANNLMNSFCIVGTALVTAAAYHWGASVQEVFAGVAVLSAVTALGVWVRGSSAK